MVLEREKVCGRGSVNTNTEKTDRQTEVISEMYI